MDSGNGFQRMDSGFILQWDSVLHKLDSGFQCSIFWIPQANIFAVFRYLDYLTWVEEEFFLNAFQRFVKLHSFIHKYNGLKFCE